VTVLDTEFLEAMRLGVDYSFVVAVRGFKLRLRPLSISETVRVMGEVADDIAALPPAQRRPLTESVILTKKTLIAASTSDVGVSDVKVTDYMLDRMTPDEMQYLYKQYLDGCDKVNPSLEKLPLDQIVAAVEALKKSAQDPEALDSQLTSLSRSHLLNLMCYLLTKGD
jgi:hypothetical protein